MDKNEVTRKVTDEYISQLVITPDTTCIEISKNLLIKIHVEYGVHNTIAPKDEKWRLSEYIECWQVSDLMRATFHFVDIICAPQNTNEDSNLLGVYVDERVAAILGDRRKLGIYITDESAIKKIAKEFRRNINEKEQNEILSDIKMYAKKIERCKDRDLVAVNNGIFHYDTKVLEDFSPEYVFLTKSCIDYEPNASNPIITMSNGETWDVETWLHETVDDDEIYDLIWEITSALLRPNVRWNQACFLYSKSGNSGNMKHKNIAAEILQRLLDDNIQVLAGINVVKAKLFSERFNDVMKRYNNNMVTSAEVIGELLELAQTITEEYNSGNEKGLTKEELAFYDALVEDPEVLKSMKDEILVEMAHELTDLIRKSRTVDWDKKESARAYMRTQVKHLLRKYKYPPEQAKNAIDVVIKQAELMSANIMLV